jgi:hypothetical protein
MNDDTLQKLNTKTESNFLSKLYSIFTIKKIIKESTNNFLLDFLSGSVAGLALTFSGYPFE